MTSQTRPSAAIYIAYWSLKDPLFQSQSLPVVRALAAAGHPMAVITFEQDRWRLTEEQRQRLPVEFAAQGITWVPLTYHKQPRGLATVFDIVQGVLACLRLAWRTPVRVIHGRGTVPNAMAWIASRFTRARFFNDADGPLSEEYADARIWSRRSLSYRLTRFVERRCLCSADEVAVLSDLRRQEVAPLSRRQVTVLPCAVDTQSFFPQLAARVAIRQELGLKGLVFVYAGKSGGWYETEWMWDFLKAAQETIQACSVWASRFVWRRHRSAPVRRSRSESIWRADSVS
ncbi:MAG: glycosyltransferase [Vicinamibacteria bacterium]|nr:glycosyltransferase [Vicinamibacteria bacterium]